MVVYKTNLIFFNEVICWYKVRLCLRLDRTRSLESFHISRWCRETCSYLHFCWATAGRVLTYRRNSVLAWSRKQMSRSLHRLNSTNRIFASRGFPRGVLRRPYHWILRTTLIMSCLRMRRRRIIVILIPMWRRWMGRNTWEWNGNREGVRVVITSIDGWMTGVLLLFCFILTFCTLSLINQWLWWLFL